MFKVTLVRPLKNFVTDDLNSLPDSFPVHSFTELIEKLFFNFVLSATGENKGAYTTCHYNGGVDHAHISLDLLKSSQGASINANQPMNEIRFLDFDTFIVIITMLPG